jgi:putative oxidoreductase
MRVDPYVRWHGWAAAILRIVVGAVFAAHGVRKLFVRGLDDVLASFGTLGIPWPEAATMLVTLVELLGGVALILGFQVRWAALLLAIEMLVAILVAHLPHGFFLPDGVEFALILFAANVALAFLGAGHVSLDTRPRRRR